MPSQQMETSAGSQETAEWCGRHLKRAGFAAGGVTGLSTRTLGERGWEVNQGSQGEGQDPSALTDRAGQEKRKCTRDHCKHNGKDLVSEPDGLVFKTCFYFDHLCDPGPAFNLSEPHCKSHLAGLCLDSPSFFQSGRILLSVDYVPGAGLGVGCGGERVPLSSLPA